MEDNFKEVHLTDGESKSMKILIVVDNLCKSNGVSRVNENLAKEWVRKGNEVKILSFEGGDIDNIEVIKFRKLIFPKKEDIKQIEKIVDSIRPDIIFCNAGRLGLLVSLKYKVLCRYGGSFPKEWYLTIHEGLKPFMASSILHLIQLFNIWRSEILFVPSKYTKNIFNKFFYKDIYHIYNGLDNRLFKEKGKKINLGKNPLLYIGEIKGSKGINLLIDSFRRVNKILPETTLHIIGKASSIKLFKRLKKEKNIIYHGTLSNVAPYIRGCKIFLFPSYSEGFGLSPLEAQACGKPVIALNCTSLPEVVKNNHSGYLIKKDNVEEFVEKIIFLIENSKVANSMGKKGIKISKRFDWDKVAKQYLKVFKEVIEKTKE